MILLRAVLTLALLPLTAGNLVADLIWHSALDGDGSAITGADGIPRGTITPTNDREGNPGAALYFGGDTAPGTLTVPPAAATFTAGSISIWIRVDNNDDSQDGFVAIGASGNGDTQYFSIQKNGNGTIRTDLDDGDTRLPNATETPVAVGEWLHVVSTFTAGGRLRIYLDGVEQFPTAPLVEVPAGNFYTMTNNWLIGSERPGERFFEGAIDDVRVYDNELSAVEVGTIFSGGPLFLGLADDPDRDLMPTAWEITNGLNPNLDDSAEDPDGDLLRNLDEYRLGSDPQNADTDGDTLNDFAEVNGGTDPASRDSDKDRVDDNVEIITGTDPSDPDTDDDLLPDGVETNTGLFLSADDTGTDPNDPDSDGDGLSDQTEVIHGSNPNINITTTALTQILFVGRNPGPTSGADPAVFDFLRRRYGSDTIVYREAANVADGAWVNFDLAILSSTSRSDDLRNKFEDSTTPVVNWEPGILGDGAGELQISRDSTNFDDITTFSIFDDTHPIVRPFGNNDVLFFDFPSRTHVPDGLLGLDVFTVGLIAGADAILIVEQGGNLLGNGTVGRPETAAGRRVHLPLNDRTFYTTSQVGRELIGRSIDWALGIIQLPIAITSTNFDATTREFTIEWDSFEGVNYRIENSTDLETWIPSDAPIPGGTRRTTAVIDPPETAVGRRFFRVLQVP